MTTSNQDFNTDEIEKNTLLQSVYTWFSSQIDIYIGTIIAGVHINFDDLITFVKKSEKNKKLLLKLVALTDSNIQDIQIFELTKASNILKSHTRAYPYTRPEDGEDVMVAIKTTHSVDKKDTQFDFFLEESTGTQQLFAWLGYWLLKLQEGAQPKIFVVDELGTSLHPLLTQLLVKIFYNKKLNPHNAQLIFTTHEVKLMDKKIMRPDQLFLINKDSKGNTSIETIADYEENDKYNRFDNQYMYGSMSGIPNISERKLEAVL